MICIRTVEISVCISVLFCEGNSIVSVCGAVLTVLYSQHHVPEVKAGLLLRQRTVSGHLHHRPGGNGTQLSGKSQAQNVIAVQDV